MLFFNRKTIQAIADFLKKSNNEITRFFCVHLEYNDEKIRSVVSDGNVIIRQGDPEFDKEETTNWSLDKLKQILKIHPYNSYDIAFFRNENQVVATSKKDKRGIPINMPNCLTPHKISYPKYEQILTSKITAENEIMEGKIALNLNVESLQKIANYLDRMGARGVTLFLSPESNQEKQIYFKSLNEIEIDGLMMPCKTSCEIEEFCREYEIEKEVGRKNV